MTKNAYWDELGIAWRAIHPETEIVIPRLKSRLRGQSWLIAGYVTGGLLLVLAGALLGGYTLWHGWTFGPLNFVGRGVVLLMISGIMAVAALGLLPVIRGDQARTLPEMIDLTIARAEKLLAAIRLGLLACAIVAVLAMIGTVTRAYSGYTPAGGPILNWVVLAALALGLFFYDRRVNMTRRKFLYLKDVFFRDDI